jgi:hypothetical protein
MCSQYIHNYPQTWSTSFASAIFAKHAWPAEVVKLVDDDI